MKKLFFLLTCLFFFTASAAVKEENYKHYLSAAAIFRDEAGYLKEWIEYHKLMGIEHFYLYNNLSQDDYLSVLKPYIDNGEIELFEWPYENSAAHPWTQIQRAAYRDAVDKSIHRTKWLALFDTDEFFVPLQHDSLASLIASEESKKSNKKIARYEISWILFGTSGVENIPEGKLMIELLTQNEGRENIMAKSIVRPQFVGNYINPHLTSLTKGMKFLKLPLSSAQLNHYILRDRSFLHQVKIPRVARYFSKVDYLYRIDEACCHINPYSDKIFRFIPALKSRMGLSE